MTKINLLLIVLFFAINVHAQSDSSKSNNDTIFYQMVNGNIITCKNTKAEGFSINNTDSIYSVQKIYYLHTKNLMAEYENNYEIDNLLSFIAKITIYSTIPIKNGKYEDWYPSGEKRVSCFYTKNKLSGIFRMFYKNKNLKRMDLWENGEWKSGECYDENGNKTQYYPYQEQAEFTGGLTALTKYLNKNLRYPKYAEKEGIEGKVYVGFVVDTDGSIIDIVVARGVEQHLDNEAIRVISGMPKWKPGKYEGTIVQTSFTLPIHFNLE